MLACSVCPSNRIKSELLYLLQNSFYVLPCENFPCFQLYCKLGFPIHPIHYDMSGRGGLLGLNHGLGFKIEQAKVHSQAKQTEFC